MNSKLYDRKSALSYAQKWALSRNPQYYNFDPVGGDCTNFVSQCLFAGSKKMNYTNWYYNNGYDKSPSWSGVEFLYNFLIKNKGYGPRGIVSTSYNIKIGDIAQLSFDGNHFGHSLFIVGIGSSNSLNNIAVATHTFDAFGKRISDYNFAKIRFVHIKDVGY